MNARIAYWWAILVATWQRISRDNLSALAAGAAFQALLTIFPTLTAVVSLYGLVADPNTVERQITAMQGVLPPEAVKLIATWLHALVEGATASSVSDLSSAFYWPSGVCGRQRRC